MRFYADGLTTGASGRVAMSRQQYSAMGNIAYLLPFLELHLRDHLRFRHVEDSRVQHVGGLLPSPEEGAGPRLIHAHIPHGIHTVGKNVRRFNGNEE